MTSGMLQKRTTSSMAVANDKKSRKLWHAFAIFIIDQSLLMKDTEFEAKTTGWNYV